MRKLSVLLLSAATLTACGSNSDPPVAPLPAPTPAPPVTSDDAFFHVVEPIARSQQDGADPQDVSKLSATAPEQTEAQTL